MDGTGVADPRRKNPRSEGSLNFFSPLLLFASAPSTLARAGASRIPSTLSRHHRDTFWDFARAAPCLYNDELYRNREEESLEDRELHAEGNCKCRRLVLAWSSDPYGRTRHHLVINSTFIMYPCIWAVSKPRVSKAEGFCTLSQCLHLLLSPTRARRTY